LKIRGSHSNSMSSFSKSVVNESGLESLLQEAEQEAVVNDLRRTVGGKQPMAWPVYNSSDEDDDDVCEVDADLHTYFQGLRKQDSTWTPERVVKYCRLYASTVALTMRTNKRRKQ